MGEAAKPRTAAVNARLWGARARDWAEVQEVLARPLYEAVFARAGLKPGVAYLDAGCGAGLAAQIASTAGALEALPYADKSFDLVTGFNAFQFAGNPAAALGEARRVLKPGGTVAIVTWGKPEGMQAAALVTSLKALMPTPPPGAPGGGVGIRALSEVTRAAACMPSGLPQVTMATVPPGLSTRRASPSAAAGLPANWNALKPVTRSKLLSA